MALAVRILQNFAISKLREKAVAGILDGTAPVFPDLRFNQLLEMCLQAFVRALLVRSHSREYPATSAARRRTEGISCPAVDCLNQA
jgi:hypothetical protein